MKSSNASPQDARTFILSIPRGGGFGLGTHDQDTPYCAVTLAVEAACDRIAPMVRWLRIETYLYVGYAHIGLLAFAIQNDEASMEDARLSLLDGVCQAVYDWCWRFPEPGVRFPEPGADADASVGVSV